MPALQLVRWLPRGFTGTVLVCCVACVPLLAQQAPAPAPTPEDEARIPRLYLNQSGFNAGKPKRFTAPTLPAGTPFVVKPAAGGPPAFEGTIGAGIGDFTPFEPGDTREYVVVAGPHTSVPFRVGPWWLERVTYQRAIDFMVDSRHYVGNVREVCVGSFGWRDDHHFGWELHTLVPQYLSNPSAYERMPHQVSYEAPTNRALWGALQPYREDAPDVVKLIHWGADVIVTQGLTPRTAEVAARVLPLRVADAEGLPARPELRRGPRLRVREVGRDRGRPQVPV